MLKLMLKIFILATLVRSAGAVEHWGFDNPSAIPAYARQHIRDVMLKTSVSERKHVKANTPGVLVIHWQSDMFTPITAYGTSLPSNCDGEVAFGLIVAACTNFGSTNTTMNLNRWFYRGASKKLWRSVLDYEITIALGKGERKGE